MKPNSQCLFQLKDVELNNPLTIRHPHKMINYLQIAQHFFEDEKWNCLDSEQEQTNYSQLLDFKQSRNIQPPNCIQLKLGESAEGSFQGLTNQQLLNIFADEPLFNEVLKKKTDFPHQIHLLVWKLHYLIGEVIIQVQSHLSKTKQLSDSIMLQPKQVHAIANGLIECSSTPFAETQMEKIDNIKQSFSRIYERGVADHDKDMLQIYNYCIENCKPFLFFELQMNYQQKLGAPNQKDNQEQPNTSMQIEQQNPSSKMELKATQNQFNILNQQLHQRNNYNLQVEPKFSPYLNEPRPVKRMGKYNLQQVPSAILNDQSMTKYSTTNRADLNHDRRQYFNSTNDQHYNKINKINPSFLYQQNPPNTYHPHFSNNQPPSIPAPTQKYNYSDTKPPRKQNKQPPNSKRQTQKQTFELCHPKNIKPSQTKRQYIKTLQSRLQQTRMVKLQEGDRLKNINENSNKTPSRHLATPPLKNQQKSQKETIQLEDTITIIDGQQSKNTPPLGNKTQSSLQIPSNQPNSANNNPSSGSSKQVKRHFKQKWSSQQDSVLVKNYIEKGGLHHCVTALKQAYGDNQKYQPEHIKYRIDLIVHRVFMKFASLNTKNQNIIQFRQNKEFILRKSGLAPRRRMYQDILTIYSSMLNMSEEKRQLISKKIIEINHICIAERQTRTTVIK